MTATTTCTPSPMHGRRRALAVALTAIALVLPASWASAARVEVPAQAKPDAHYGAIFQIDNGGDKAIKKTLNNIENLLQDPRLKGHITVELLANSKGFDVYVKNNGFEERLEKLRHDGVILAQCSNTLRELHVDRSNLYPFITIVPSGVGEITLRQAQGWAYIHPGAPKPSNDF